MLLSEYENLKVPTKFNYVMIKNNFFIRRTCEYYLYYHISKPLPENEDKKSCKKKLNRKKKSLIFFCIYFSLK